MELLLDFLNQIKNNKSVEILSIPTKYTMLSPDEKQAILPADLSL